MKKIILLLLLIVGSWSFGQSRISAPVPDISAVYFGYENPVLFSNVSSKMQFTVHCTNGALSYRDSVWFIRPYTMTKACTLVVTEQTTKKRIGWYELPVRELGSPAIYFDSIPSGGLLTGSEQWLRCGYDVNMNIRFVKYRVLNHQLFVENRAPRWVNPGGGISQDDAEELNKLSTDAEKTKVRFILQVIDHNGEISNKGAEFEI